MDSLGLIPILNSEIAMAILGSSSGKDHQCGRRLTLYYF
jgi:hypothetical protein